MVFIVSGDPYPSKNTFFSFLTFPPMNIVSLVNRVNLVNLPTVPNQSSFVSVAPEQAPTHDLPKSRVFKGFASGKHGHLDHKPSGYPSAKS